MQQPLVSCILPTYNRRQYMLNAIRYFLRQDYARKELVILDDGTDSIEDLVPHARNIRYYRLDQKITLGAKLNLACTYATGDILAHWDDDDWYAVHRLSYQVAAMQQKGIQLCGINQLLYLNLHTKDAYLYAYPPNQKIWLSGSSLCYTRSLWEKIRFADVNVGMDGLFVWATPPDQIKVLEDNTFSVLMIHGDNVSPKKTDNNWWRSHPVDAIKQILGPDWKYYSGDPQPLNGHAVPAVKQHHVHHKPATQKDFKNVYACLVHERPECILDLVQNLHYHDPHSTILLYNGSTNPGLISGQFSPEQYGAVVHPNPKPQQHGYLHHFALDCMAFALEKLDFDTLTIVDSDQLAVRSGYSQYLAANLATNHRIGLLSCMPGRVTPDNKTNRVALQAFQEIELWKPFLQQFPDGENQFVHWTFWPATVFTRPAARDLVQLVQGNQMLQSILRQTKIWAAEEVVLPTLVKLLGYEIALNPCSTDYVQYRKAFSTQDADQAMARQDVYWMHPVERRLDNSIRRHIRERYNGYNGVVNGRPAATIIDFQPEPLVQAIKNIEGWLNDEEALLLVRSAAKALRELPPPHRVVDIGCYHGKSTVLLAKMVKSVSSETTVCAVDPHDGLQGAVDQGLKAFPPSLDSFKKNIREAGLSDVVDIKIARSYEVPWSEPLSFLYIDGLHDYTSVSRDFYHFSKWLKPGAYIAFHDYADYFPGVKKFVHELLKTGRYNQVELKHSMIVLQYATN